MVRYGLPLILASNCALFLSGHLQMGASVDLAVTFAGDSLTVPTVYSFSLGASLTDMWTAGAYPLALLIGVFSGAWPYIKLICLTACWQVKPPTAFAFSTTF